VRRRACSDIETARRQVAQAPVRHYETAYRLLQPRRHAATALPRHTASQRYSARSTAFCAMPPHAPVLVRRRRQPQPIPSREMQRRNIQYRRSPSRSRGCALRRYIARPATVRIQNLKSIGLPEIQIEMEGRFCRKVCFAASPRGAPGAFAQRRRSAPSAPHAPQRRHGSRQHAARPCRFAAIEKRKYAHQMKTAPATPRKPPAGRRPAEGMPQATGAAAKCAVSHATAAQPRTSHRCGPPFGTRTHAQVTCQQANRAAQSSKRSVPQWKQAEGKGASRLTQKNPYRVASEGEDR